MEVILPFIPKSLNDLLAMNLFARAKYTKEVKEDVAWQCKQNRLKVDKLPVDVNILIVSKSKHKKDCDNYTGKAIIDGLVMGGVLPDDNTDYIRSITVEIQYGKADETRIKLLTVEGLQEV